MSKPLLLGVNGKTDALVGNSNADIPSWSASAQEWVAIPNNASGAAAGVFFFNFGNTTGLTPDSVLPITTAPNPSKPNTTPSLLGPTFNPTATNVESGALINGTYKFVAGFVTPALSPNVTSIPKGLWDFNIWANSTAALNGTQVSMQARVYIMNGAGTAYGSSSGGGGNDQLPAATSDEVFLYEQATVAQYILNVTFGTAVPILATDRIYIELWARKTVNPPRTITFYFATNQPSHVHTTLPNLVDLGTGVTGILPLANGGTNKALTATNGVVYSDSDSLEILASVLADDGKFLKSNGTGAPTWGTPTFTQAYDLRGKFVGNPATGIVLDSFVADRAFTISSTNTNHKFWADEKTAGADVVITVQRTRAGVTSTIFTATSASSDTGLNGYFPMAISTPITVTDIAVNDLIEVVMGTTQAAFASPVWTIYGTAP